MHVVTTSLSLSRLDPTLCPVSLWIYAAWLAGILEICPGECLRIPLDTPKKVVPKFETQKKVEKKFTFFFEIFENFWKFSDFFSKFLKIFQLSKIILNTFLSIFGKTFFWVFGWCVFGMLGTVDTTKYTVGDQLLTNCTAKLSVASPALLRGHILVWI